MLASLRLIQENVRSDVVGKKILQIYVILVSLKYNLFYSIWLENVVYSYYRFVKYLISPQMPVRRRTLFKYEARV